MNHPQLKTYYKADRLIFTERELITDDKQILIPDRLVFDKENKVTIIDYKTGKPENKHRQQIESYGKVLKNMNFTVLEKILVYIDDEILVEKV